MNYSAAVDAAEQEFRNILRKQGHGNESSAWFSMIVLAVASVFIFKSSIAYWHKPYALAMGILIPLFLLSLAVWSYLELRRTYKIVRVVSGKTPEEKQRVIEEYLGTIQFIPHEQYFRKPFPDKPSNLSQVVFKQERKGWYTWYATVDLSLFYDDSCLLINAREYSRGSWFFSKRATETATKFFEERLK